MPGAGAVQASKKRHASDVPTARAAKAARRASADSSDTTNISAASPVWGRNSPTDMRLLFTTAARSTRCKRATGPTRSLVAGKYLRAKARGLRSSGQRGGSSSQVQHMVDLSGATDRLSRRSEEGRVGEECGSAC